MLIKRNSIRMLATALLAGLILPLAVQPARAQQAKKRIINRYSMRLIPQKDGSYKLDSKTLAVLDGAEPEGLYEPYQIVPVVPTSKVSDVSVEKVVYKQYPDREEVMLVCKAVNATVPTPVVCFIHGGGWSAGSETGYRKHIAYLAKYEGLAAVSIGYTLAGAEGADIAVTMMDLHDAVQYLREHAAEYNLDMTRLAFAGSSAGGHLSAMMALTEPCAKVHSGWSGVYDITAQRENWSKSKNQRLYRYFFMDDENRSRSYSPIHIIPGDRQIAVQLFHGTGDATVPCDQTIRYAEALRQAGYRTVECNIYPYYSHGLTGSSDKGRECFAKFIKFVKAHIYE